MIFEKTIILLHFVKIFIITSYYLVNHYFYFITAHTIWLLNRMQAQTSSSPAITDEEVLL